ncbi:hypothetical protein [Sinomicrobium sp. M5D2P9]
MKIDLTNSKLLDSLLEIDFGKSSYYDIHNDFVLIAVELKGLSSELVLKFVSSNKGTLLRFVFKDVDFIEFLIPTDMNELVLDNFHRGRYEINGKLYDEYNNKKCFYIEFCEKGNLNFLCSKAFLEAESNGKVINLQDEMPK